MGLFGSIYVGKSGVSSMSHGIGVTADNLANLESTGFRGSRALFEDFFARANTEAPPYDEKGLGSRVKDIEVLYNEGPIKQTGQPSDMAISGKGFFTVSDGENLYYTRDGQFLPREVEEGRMRLSLPTGYDLLGWICPEGVDCSTITSGDLTPVEFARYINGQATSKITIQMNFDTSKPAEETDSNLFDLWNANNSPPLEDGAYDFKVDIPVYDGLGNLHDLNLYVDRTSDPQVFEFLIGIPPEADPRGTGPYSGALMTGRIRFGYLGQLESLEDLQLVSDVSGTRTPLNTYSDEGFPVFTVDFGAGPQQIALDFGTRFNVANNTWERLEDHASTAFASPYAVLNQNVDGYPPGFFETLNITEDGVLQISYTNNQTFDVARIPLALFGSPDELKRAGGNLFKAVAGTTPEMIPPGKSSPGAIFGGALEGSNVDVANEMVHLITLQRTFQSNARIITTADQMLEDFLRQV
ncbi:flagellar hook protein FlgE [Thermodesulfatator atlanticus]